MTKKLNFRQSLVIASMLFGLFFGAGNLIFPVSMGQLAGADVWQASAGFLLTGVGLPILGVAALGISRENGLLELSSRASGTEQPDREGVRHVLYLCFVSDHRSFLRHSKVCHSIFYHRAWDGAFSAEPDAGPGDLLLCLLRGGPVSCPAAGGDPDLGVLVLRALTAPMGEISEIAPQGAYASGAFFKGFLEGYNTMDALAGLAFGIIVINVIRTLGVEEPEDIAVSTVKAGVFTAIIMSAIYLLITVVGTQSRGVFPAAANGGDALVQISEYYFGSVGIVILALIGTVACLKTAVGLITSCGATFEKMFPSGPSYRVWAVIFAVVSFVIANAGLNAIIAYSVPVLMFLYPLAVALILLTLFGKAFGNDRIVYRWVIGFTLIAALVDFFNALPEGTARFLHITGVAQAARDLLPLGDLGFGWLCPGAVGLVIGLILHKRREAQETKK